MQLNLLFEALASNWLSTIKSGLIGIHLLGLIVGLGSATMLDIIIVRFIATNRISNDKSRIIDVMAKSISIGLAMLWLSGIGFLIYYANFDQPKLQNPKIWAKASIVLLLTLNGVFIHRAILPLIRERIGRGLFDGMSSARRSVLLASGAISATSWYVPLALGALPQLNFVVPALTILLTYALILTAAIVGTQVIGRYLLPQVPTVTLERAQYEALMRRLVAVTRASRARAGSRGRHGVTEITGPPTARLFGRLRVGGLAAVSTSVAILGFLIAGGTTEFSRGRISEQANYRSLEAVLASATPEIAQQPQPDLHQPSVTFDSDGAEPVRVPGEEAVGSRNELLLKGAPSLSSDGQVQSREESHSDAQTSRVPAKSLAQSPRRRSVSALREPIEFRLADGRK